VKFHSSKTTAARRHRGTAQIQQESKPMKQEQRYYSSEVSIRTINGRPHLCGLACPYGRVGRDLGGFREVVKRGAFRKVLQKDPDVFMLYNHKSDAILGRTKSRTLSLRDTDEGLAFDVELPNTQLGMDIAELCSRQDIGECSYGFVADPEDSDWDDNVDVMDEDEDRKVRCTLRTLKNFRALTDVSLVATPANFGTHVALVRSLGNLPEDVKRHIVMPTAAQVSSVNRRKDLLRIVLG
jgi:uncharacterized protein